MGDGGGADDRGSPLAGTEVHHLTSAHVGDEFKIFVGHCGTAGARAVEVLYLTDANGFFGMAVDVVRSLQLMRHLPPLVVVGVGYPVGGLSETVVHRTRDLTPSPDVDVARLVPEQAGGGGAAAMHAFLRHELVPWVAGRYDVDPGPATYFGHSLGGLFGAWALLQDGSPFRRYILGSPSLWWDRGAIFRHEDAYAAGHGDLRADVFTGIGADETHGGRAREAVNLPPGERRVASAWYLDMVDDLDRLVRRLEGRRYPGLRLRHVVLPGEFHTTVAPLVLSRGLRHLFDAPR